MQKTSGDVLTKFRLEAEKSEKEKKEEQGVILLLAFIATAIIILVTDTLLDFDASRRSKIFDPFISAVSLQIFPLFFGWAARNNNSLQRYWLAVYWLTLAACLIARGILLAGTAG